MCLSMSLAAGSTHRLLLVFSLDGIFFSGCFPSFVQLGGFCLLNLRCCDFFCGHVGGGGYFSFFSGSLCLFRNLSILSLNVCNSVVVSGYGLCSKRAYAAEGLLKCNTNLEQHKCSVSEVKFLSPISAFLWICNQADFVM